MKSGIICVIVFLAIFIAGAVMLSKLASESVAGDLEDDKDESKH
jgi:hypothetical protein